MPLSSWPRGATQALHLTAGLASCIPVVLKFKGHLRSIDFALAHDCKSDDVTLQGFSLLMRLAEGNHIDADRYALKLGADPPLADDDSHTSFDVAESDEMRSLLLQATEDFNSKPSANLPPASAPPPSADPSTFHGDHPVPSSRGRPEARKQEAPSNGSE